jgi:hypothetical protein
MTPPDELLLLRLRLELLPLLPRLLELPLLFPPRLFLAIAFLLRMISLSNRLND